MRWSRELWLWLGGLLLAGFGFLVAIAIAYFEKTSQASLWSGWMVAALVAFAASFACFFGATQAWAVSGKPTVSLPDIRVDVFATAATDTEREAGSGFDVAAHLRSFNVRLANADTVRTASLTIRLYAGLVPGSFGRAAECVCPPPTWALPRSLNLDPLAMPVELAPGGSLSGQLVFEVPGYCRDKLATPFVGRLEVEDRITGKSASMSAEIGQYDRSNMVAGTPGAALLGQQASADGDRADGPQHAEP